MDPAHLPKALIIHHLRSDPDDAATKAVAGAGFELDHRYPIEGDLLPSLDEGHALAVVHGSMADVTKHDEPGIAEEMRWIEQWWKTDRPFLGICHGLQLACQLLGARIGPPSHGQAEFGYYPLKSFATNIVPDGLPVFQWHYYGADIPSEAQRLAGSDFYPNQVVRFSPTSLGLQCHAEMSLAGQYNLRKNDHGWENRQGVQSPNEQARLSEENYQRMRSWFSGLMHHWLAESR